MQCFEHWTVCVKNENKNNIQSDCKNNCKLEKKVFIKTLKEICKENVHLLPISVIVDR